MVRMGVSDQHIIYAVRQVGVSIAMDITLVLVTDNRVRHDANVFSLYENTCVVQIAHTQLISVVFRGPTIRLSRQKISEEGVIVVSEPQFFLDIPERLQRIPHLKQ